MDINERVGRIVQWSIFCSPTIYRIVKVDEIVKSRRTKI